MDQIWEMFVKIGLTTCIFLAIDDMTRIMFTFND